MLKAKPSLSSPEFMEEDGEEEAPRSPFWLQTTTNVSRVQLYRRRLSSLFFSSVVLIIFLLLLAILLSMVFVIPNVIDFSSNVLKQNLVKKSWDSINLILVLVALAFGFLSRNINNDEKLSYDRSESELSAGAPVISPSSSTPHQWYDFPDQSMSPTIGLRRQKTSSSYPNLRELSPPWDHHAADPWRFSDDTHLNYYKVLESNRNHLRQRNRREQYSGNQGDVDVNAFGPFGGVSQGSLYAPPPIPAVAEEGLYLPPPEQMPPPSLPPQPPAHMVKKKIKRRARSSEPRKVLSPVIDPLPEPPSPPPVKQLTERKTHGGNATKEFFTSFYHKKKKKRQKERSFDDLQGLLHHSRSSAVRFQLPPPSPPPPPPHHPPSVLHKLFPTKKDKRKSTTSLTLSPPAPAPAPAPPPPDLPPPPRTSALTRGPTRSRSAPFLTDNPRIQSIQGFTSIEDSSSGGDSPMKQIPPPPPPLPPFKVPDWEFAVEGDFVSLQSALSSRSVSPVGDEAQSPSSVGDVAVAPPLFCPSPDVDAKADNFIESFRARLQLERVSKLGPSPDSCPAES